MNAPHRALFSILLAALVLTFDCKGLAAQPYKRPHLATRIGQIKVTNNTPTPAVVELFHPDSGTLFATYPNWDSGKSSFLASGGKRFNVGDDWGIRVNGGPISSLKQHGWYFNNKENFFEIYLNFPAEQARRQSGTPLAKGACRVYATRAKGFSMAADTNWLWPNGSTITVGFLDGDPAVQRKVAAYASQWTEYANLKFSFVYNSAAARNADIRVTFANKDGYHSALGRQSLGGKPGPSLALQNAGGIPEGELKRHSLHEFGHAIGLVHEHQNPAFKITWIPENVYNYFAGPPNNWPRTQVDYNIFRQLDAASTNYTQFDSRSIMCYFIEPDWNREKYKVSANSELSVTDRSQIGVIYPRTVAAQGTIPPNDPRTGHLRFNNQERGDVRVEIWKSTAERLPAVWTVPSGKSQDLYFQGKWVKGAGNWLVSAELVGSGNQTPIFLTKVASYDVVIPPARPNTIQAGYHVWNVNSSRLNFRAKVFNGF